jgi:hypothetical protein
VIWASLKHKIVKGKSRHIRFVSLFFVAIIGLSCFAPITLTVEGDNSFSTSSLRPVSSPSLLESKITWSGEEVIQVYSPVISPPGVLQADQIISNSGWNTDCGCYLLSNNESLEVAGIGGWIDFRFYSSGGGNLSFESNFEEKWSIGVEAGGVGVQRVEAPQTSHKLSGPVFFLAIFVLLNPETLVSVISSPQQDIAIAAKQFGVIVQMLTAGLISLLLGGSALLLVPLMILILSVIGSAFRKFVGVFQSRISFETPIFDPYIGLLLVLILTNHLSYVIPSKVGVFVIAGALSSLSLIRYFINRCGPKEKSISSQVVRDISEAWVSVRNFGLLPYLVTIVAFFPALFWGLSFAGGYKTDFADNASVVSLSRNSSLIEINLDSSNQAFGSFSSGAGFSWRSSDSVFAGYAAEVFQLPSSGAITLASMVLFTVTVHAILLFAKGRKNSSISLKLAVIGGTATLAGLFYENYLSQFFFMCLVIIQFFVMGLLSKNRDSDLLRWLALSTNVAAFSVYPTFWVFLSLSLLVAHFRLFTSNFSPVFFLKKIIAPWLLMAGMSVIPAIYVSQAGNFTARLNEITTNVLLTPFSNLDFLGLFVGVVPFNSRLDSNSVFVSSVFSDFFPNWEIFWMSNSQTVTTVALVLLVFVLLAVIVEKPSALSQTVFLGFLLSLFIFTLLAFWQALNLEFYAAFKLFWSASVLFLVVFITLAASTRSLFGRLSSSVLSILLIVSGLTNSSAWLSDRTADYASVSHVTSELSINNLSKQLVYIPVASKISVFEGEQSLRGSDKDRILSMHSGIIIRDLGLECENCVGWGQIPELTCQVTQDWFILIGPSRNEEICEGRLVWSDGTLSLWKK